MGKGRGGGWRLGFSGLKVTLNDSVIGDGAGLDGVINTIELGIKKNPPVKSVFNQIGAWKVTGLYLYLIMRDVTVCICI